jgi:hypothetical protein
MGLQKGIIGRFRTVAPSSVSIRGFRVWRAFDCLGAGGGTRTRKPLRTMDFESIMFANFITPAEWAFYRSALGTNKGVEEGNILFAGDRDISRIRLCPVDPEQVKGIGKNAQYVCRLVGKHVPGISVALRS